MNITRRRKTSSYQALSIPSSRKRALKRASKVILVVFIVLFIVVGSVLLYIWLTGKQVPVAQTPLPEPKKVVLPERKPPKVAADAKLGTYVSQVSTPLKPGENASLTLSTLPDARCTIVVEYGDTVKAVDSGLTPKVSDEYGQIVWSWTVEASAPTGKWPVKINCTRAKQSSYVKSEIEIKP